MTADAENAGLLPWHQPLWQRLARDFQRLPHALLLHGLPGLGKHRFAQVLAQAWLCAGRDARGQACGRCKNCQLFAAGTHPDYSLIAPAEAGKAITVDQIRALAGFLALRPHTAAGRAVIIAPADSMNLNAANSLLKTLEEPPAGSLLLLISDRPTRLPATVRSRCVPAAFPVPARAAALAWLESSAGLAGEEAQALLAMAGGAPLAALAWGAEYREQGRRLLADLESLAGQGDPVECAARWRGLGAGRCLGWLQGCAADLVRGVVADPASPSWISGETAPQLRALAKRLNLKQLLQFYDRVSEARQLLTSPVDELLLLEDVLIRWRQTAQAVPHTGRSPWPTIPG